VARRSWEGDSELSGSDSCSLESAPGQPPAAPPIQWLSRCASSGSSAAGTAAP
jgi:hypothetical protein